MKIKNKFISQIFYLLVGVANLVGGLILFAISVSDEDVLCGGLGVFCVICGVGGFCSFRSRSKDAQKNKLTKAKHNLLMSEKEAELNNLQQEYDELIKNKADDTVLCIGE